MSRPNVNCHVKFWECGEHKFPTAVQSADHSHSVSNIVSSSKIFMGSTAPEMDFLILLLDAPDKIFNKTTNQGMHYMIQLYKRNFCCYKKPLL